MIELLSALTAKVISGLVWVDPSSVDLLPYVAADVLEEAVYLLNFDTFYFSMYYFWRLQIFVFFCALFKLRYLHTCVSSLLMANFFLIWWITFLLDQSVPDQNKLFTRDYKMSSNNWSLCQKKIASSFLHLMLLVYKHFSFTLKYQTPWGWQSPQTVLFSFQTLCCLLWLASRALLFLLFPLQKGWFTSLTVYFPWP